ncbi:MAG: nicotinate (nicotinamide) nucleotide adenylyltransferase [Planctomycetota bacterium]
MGTLPFGPLKRFGVFGGSFDPVHVGHLSMAQQVFNALRLERVILMPAATPPHKRDGRELAPAADRLAMCELAVFNMHGLEVSDFELRKTGVSYTVETARALRQAYGPAAQIHFLIGSDSLAELPHWYQVQELLGLVDFAVVERREAPFQDSMWKTIRKALGSKAEKQLRKGVVSVEHVDVSSTLVRQLLRSGERIAGYLRRDVEDYIRTKGLYGAAPALWSREQVSGT